MTMRSVAYVGTVALLAQVFLTQGCGSNAPSTTDGTGGAASLGGSTSAGGSTVVAATGGTTTPVTTGAGGSTTPTSTGTGGAAGTTGANTFEPLCAGLLTAANLAPAKNGICSDPADPQLCYKTCGPASVGFKSETCTASVYVEQSGCSFLPEVDYSCYKVNKDANGALILDASCPTTVPQANTPCTVNTCILCNINEGYLDSSGAAKVGYCVCPAPSAATGVSKWTCAASTAWPCPAGKGC